MNMQNYRKAFVFALVGNLILVLVLAVLWWHSSRQKKTEMTMQPATNEATGTSPNGAEMVPHDAALVPVQLSPERLQSIGVRMGKVERKSVDDEIRVTGNVAVDETKLAYVQTRYTGYIQKVYADATYQYLRK